MVDIRKQFIKDVKNVTAPEVLVVAVELPSGATETIHNHQKLKEKIEYYMNAYDDEFRLIANPRIRIKGFMLV